MSIEISECNLSVAWNTGEIELELKKSIEEVRCQPVEIPESNGEQCNKKVTVAIKKHIFLIFLLSIKSEILQLN